MTLQRDPAAFASLNARKVMRIVEGQSWLLYYDSVPVHNAVSIPVHEKSRNDVAEGHPRRIFPVMHRIVAEKDGKVQ